MTLGGGGERHCVTSQKTAAKETRGKVKFELLRSNLISPSLPLYAGHAGYEKRKKW